MLVQSQTGIENRPSKKLNCQMMNEVLQFLPYSELGEEITDFRISKIENIKNSNWSKMEFMKRRIIEGMELIHKNKELFWNILTLPHPYSDMCHCCDKDHLIFSILPFLCLTQHSSNCVAPTTVLPDPNLICYEWTSFGYKCPCSDRKYDIAIFDRNMLLIRELFHQLNA